MGGSSRQTIASSENLLTSTGSQDVSRLPLAALALRVERMGSGSGPCTQSLVLQVKRGALAGSPNVFPTIEAEFC
tara:strand:- start:5 stop:229 length:225 start_codon:yes stop_codon:yes gene_type:complete